jgi:hypothetical protein
MEYSVGCDVCGSGILVNNIRITCSNGSLGACSNNCETNFLVGENMVISFSQNGFSSPGCPGPIFANIKGFLLPKSVNVIYQSTSYTVPSAKKFIVYKPNGIFPEIYYSGETVPAKINGYLINN